ncbi:CcdB family protein [Rhizobium sp. LjRoot30]|uniref:CcdB family protein n=1 Tax=Rhizobium sp. LjRoot30 TaxID=3342320 RepID=UPI003ECE6F91
MARFHAYRIKSSHILALDLQADILSDLRVRIIAPLYPVAELSWTMARLNPRFTIGEESYVMATQRMLAMPLQDIGDEVADLSAHRDIIIAATDFLFQGF